MPAINDKHLACVGPPDKSRSHAAAFLEGAGHGICGLLNSQQQILYLVPRRSQHISVTLFLNLTAHVRPITLQEGAAAAAAAALHESCSEQTSCLNGPRIQIDDKKF